MYKKFDELFIDETKYGTKIKTDKYLSEGKYPIVDQGQKKISGYADIEEGIFKEVPAIIFGDHTRLIKYIDVPFFIGADGVKIIRSRLKKVNYKYLYYVLLNVHIPNTGYNRHFKWLKETKIFYPDSEKQKHIVEVLDKISLIIEKKNKQIEQCDFLLKSLFIEMFGDPIYNSKNWQVVQIGDIAKDVRYGTSNPAVEGGKYPYLRMNNITVDGKLDLGDLKYIDISDYELEKYVVRKGDLLFNRTNSIELVGKTTTFDLNEDMIIAGYIIRVRLNNQMLPEVLSQYMNLEVIKSKLRDMAKGAVNQANINAQELQSIRVYLPDIDIQKKFVKIKCKLDKSKYSSFSHLSA